MLDLAGKGLEARTTSTMNYSRLSAARDDRVANIGITQRSQLAGIRDISGPGVADYLGAGLKVANAYTGNEIRTQKKVTG